MNESASLPRLKDIADAAARIAPFAITTPLLRSRWLSEETGCEVMLKLECFQRTGSFKIRGAANRLAKHGSGRVVAVSAGNHARAVAECAERLGLAATIVMPVTAAPTKIDALRRYPVDLRLIGSNYDEAEEAALDLAAGSGATFVSPYNDPDVIAGQGTVASEMFDQGGPFDAVLVPTGGGGLLAGVGIVARSRHCSVIGVQPSVAAALAASWSAGRAIKVPQGPTIADGLSGNLESGSSTVAAAMEMVERFILVDEESIARAVRAIIDHEHVLAEPSGAVGVAALRAEREAFRGGRIAVILTGSNIGGAALKNLL